MKNFNTFITISLLTTVYHHKKRLFLLLYLLTMDQDSDSESIEGDVESIDKNNRADWGKAKYDYYYTDYVDKDYPSKLTAKEEKLASIEQDEALRIQRKLMSTLDDVDLHLAYEEESAQDSDEENLLELIENRNRDNKTRKRKRVNFEQQSDSEEEDDEEEEEEEEDENEDKDEDDEVERVNEQGRQRRPINMAMQKNRGLTPYKKKEYRNPRVKHKLKYKKAMSKRRRNVKQVQTEYLRYSGEASGIKTSTVKSVKLC